MDFRALDKLRISLKQLGKFNEKLYTRGRHTDDEMYTTSVLVLLNKKFLIIFFYEKHNTNFFLI